MSDYNNRKYPGEEDYYTSGQGKLYPQAPRNRYRWQLFTFILLTLVIILASTTVFLFFTRSQSSVISATATPGKPSLTPIPTATSFPTPSPTSTSVTVDSILCQADASHGWNGWNGTSDWKTLDGTLLDDGTNNTPGGSIIAPCQLPTADYAVEAKIQVINFHSCCYNNFGIAVRTSSSGGYDAGAEIISSPTARITTDYSSVNSLSSSPFAPGQALHTYRVEVKANTIKLFIDGALLASATDNQFLNAGQVGLYSSFVQLSVQSFVVTAL